MADDVRLQPELFTQEQADDIAYVINKTFKFEAVTPETFLEIEEAGMTPIGQYKDEGEAWLFDGPYDAYYEYHKMSEGESVIMINWKSWMIAMVKGINTDDMRVTHINKEALAAFKHYVTSRQAMMGGELEGLLDL